MKNTSVILIFALILSSVLAASAQQQEGVLLVHVITPAGKELSGAVVKLSSGEVTQSFRTNATGWALFKNIQPGEYVVEIIQDELVLNKTTVVFPQVGEVTLIAPLSDLIVRVIDLGGEPVKNLELKLESASGVLTQFTKTNNMGFSTFSEIPYTSVEGLGGSLTLTAELGNLTILETIITVDEPQENITVVAKLVKLNITVTNLKGEAVQRPLIVQLESEKFERRSAIREGFATFDKIPASQVAGEYQLRILYPLEEGKNITLYETRRRLDTYSEISTVLDLGELNIRVLDDRGNSLKNMKVIAEVGEAGKLPLGSTNDNGMLRAPDLPLGEYKITILHGQREVTSVSTTLDNQENEITITANTQPFTIQIVDNREKPVAGAEVRVIDQITGLEEKLTTNELGEATYYSFPGLHFLEVSYKGEKITRRTVNLEKDRIRVKLDAINFPVTIDVRDAVGRPAEGLRLRVMVDSDVLLDTALDGTRKQVLIPAPKFVVAEVLDDGKVIVKETRYLNEPTTWDIVIKPYMVSGGGLIDIGVIVAVVSLILLLIPVVYLVKTAVAKQR